jgi:hypothetical protein
MPEAYGSDPLFDKVSHEWLNLDKTTCLYKGEAAKKYNGG